MLQEAAQELFRTQGTGSKFPCVRGAITKSDFASSGSDDATVANSHPKNVRGQILQCGLATADWLAMHNPILLPGFRGSLSKQVYLFQAIAELGPKQTGERFHRDQKVMSGGEPLLTVS